MFHIKVNKIVCPRNQGPYNGKEGYGKKCSGLEEEYKISHIHHYMDNGGGYCPHYIDHPCYECILK